MAIDIETIPYHPYIDGPNRNFCHPRYFYLCGSSIKYKEKYKDFPTQDKIFQISCVEYKVDLRTSYINIYSC